MNEVLSWFKNKGWNAQNFQKKCWKAYSEGKNGILHAPTGSGKTFAIWGGVIEESLKVKKHKIGIQAIWITPLRALAVEIQKAIQIMTNDLNPELKIALRTGDTSQSERGNQKRKPSFGLVTTPESLHLLISTKDHQKTLQNLKVIVIDEWHELLGQKEVFKLN